MSTRTPSSSSSRLMLTIGLCFLVALMEGLDLQAAGIAAGGIAQAFALDKMQMGWILAPEYSVCYPARWLAECWRTVMVASAF
ncbi:hypothetical protein ACNKHR_05835 [Shigella flexneri]